MDGRVTYDLIHKMKMSNRFINLNSTMFYVLTYFLTINTFENVNDLQNVLFAIHFLKESSTPAIASELKTECEII